MAPRRKKVHYKVRLKCKNQKQKEYAKMIEEKEIVFATIIFDIPIHAKIIPINIILLLFVSVLL